MTINRRKALTVGSTLLVAMLSFMVATLSFSFYSSSAQVTYSIGGIIYLDVNLNGVKDSGESGKGNWQVTLNGVLSNGSSVGPTIVSSTASGSYQFTNLQPGTYSITEANANGWLHTSASSFSGIVISSSSLTGFDFGNIKSSTISGKPYNDIQANGVLDSGEALLPGWEFVLSGTLANGTAMSPKTTTSQPTATFSSLFPGTYTLTETSKSGWISTSPATISNIVASTSGSSNSSNFGNFKLGIVNGLVYNDTSGNGAQDTGERGAPSMTVNLYKSGNNTVFASGTTNNNGQYSIPNLVYGNYSVSMSVSSNYVTTQPTNGSYIVAVKSGSVFNDKFGVRSSSGSITGLLYNDTNGNLIKNVQEVGLSGWTVNLYKSGNSSLFRSATADSSGSYTFSNLPDATYTISASLPSPYVITQPLNNTYSVAVTAGTITNRSFGVFKNAPSLLTNFGDIVSNALEGLAVDSQGNLYDSDISNSIIRKFNQNGNQLLVFGEEGVGSGQFGTPSGIALDSHGNIWVADSNNRIQKFDHNGNFLLAFGSAGNGPSQFNFPRGLAIDSLDNLYVADTNNHRIQKFDNNGNYITTISKGGVPFSYVRIPFDVAVDSDNNVWVADTGNNRIQKFSSDGAYLATYGTYGNDTGQFSRPRGVFVGPDNEIYVTDTYNNRIQVFDENLNSLVSFGRFGGLPSQFGNPNDIVYSNDKMFVTDSANDRIQSFDDSGEFLSEFRIRPSPMEPYFTYFDQAENILVSDGHLHRILTFDPSTGALLTKFGVAGTDTGEFRGPRGMVQNSAGEIFVSDNYNNRVQKFSASGEFLLSFGSSGTGPGQFDQPRGIVIDSSGNVLVADSLNNRIQKFEQDGGFISQFSSYQPYQVNLDSSGNIYSAEGISGKVEKFDSNGNSLKVFSPFNVARGVCLDSSDNIYVVEEGMGDVRKLDPQGNLLAIIGSGGTGEGQFNAARTCQIDSNGHLWVADTGNARVQEFDANGFFVRAITLLDNSSLDFVPPVLSLPPTTYGQASNSSGGIVNYLASATDNVDGALTPLCTPESGSFFPIGATTVDCSVTDASGNSAMGSFSVNVVNIAITSVSNASPKWGTTSVAISGNTAGIAGPGVTTYHVQIDWGDGAQSGSLAVSPAGNWGPTAHTYGSGALATNPNKIVAKLQITSSSVTIAESPFSAVNVQKHTTTVTLGSIPNVQWGKPISLSATLKDADAQSSVISAMPITFDGTGVVIGTNATTNGTGIAKVTISSPSSVGTWTARAHFAGTDLYLPSDSTTRNYNTVKHGVSLALSIMPTSVVHDGTYIVRGQLRDLATGTLLPGQTISFIATSPIVISPTATDSDGLYTVSGLIAPSTPGAYNIQASYAGTSLYNSAVSPQKTLTVT